MATFRNRHGKWQARVQRKGQQPVSKSFQSKEDSQCWARQIESEIEQALDAHKTLPKSRHIVKRIADSMLWAMNNGFDDVTAEDVMPLVEKEWREEMSRLMDDSSEDVLEQLIGQRNLERMRAKRLNVMNTSNAKSVSSIKSTASSVQKKEEPRGEKIKQRDFFKALGKRK